MVETDRELRQQLSDKEEAAKNAAMRAYYGADPDTGAKSSGEDSRGDEALPPVVDGAGDPPSVVYSKGSYLFIRISEALLKLSRQTWSLTLLGTIQRTMKSNDK